MSRVNKASAPYYDDYSTEKKYTQLLAIPGRVAQAREISQIQSVMKDIIKSVGDSILKDGNIIEGCQVIVNNARTNATITAGKVYLNGMVMKVDETVVGITGSGKEIIGVKLSESIITEQEDYTLRDPAQGYDNYNQPGCHRVKSDVEVTVNDPDAATLVTLVDGVISVEKYAPNYDVLTQTLARRTYDESGSYVVEGLKVRVEDNTADATKFNVVIEAGKAYVLGYELRIPAPRRITLPRSTTFSSVTANNYWYDEDVSNYQISSAPYVKSITSVTGFVSKTVNQSLATNVDQILLQELTVSQINSVTQGDTTYTVGTSTTGDCYLKREGTRYYLQWNGTQNFPEAGTSYTVTYTYNYTFVQGTDYTLYHNTSTDGHELSWTAGAAHPLDETNFTIVYDQYLARKDIVYLDRYGDINIIQGTPAEDGFEVLPDAPVNTLSLAAVMSPPGGDISENTNLNIVVSNIGLTRFTMRDIQRLLERIRTIEYDQTILSLNDEARQYETTNSKRGIFTDPLIDFSKIDFYYNLSEGVAIDATAPIYDVSIDFNNNSCYLPVVSEIHDMVYNSTTSTSHKYDRLLTLAKTGESVVLSQNNATKAFLINPYSVFNMTPEISITPAVDVWIDDNIITIPVSRNGGTQIVKAGTRVVATHTTTVESRAGRRTISVTDTTAGANSETSINESILEERAITYIRPRTITVTGTQFYPELDNIKCYFDGVVTPLTPISPTVAGTQAGTVKSDITGNLSASFLIPENVLTGVREVRLIGSTDMGYGSSAFALYTAAGTSRTIQRTVTTITTILINRVTNVEDTTFAPNVDPVGQTFVLDKMTLISGVDVYFAAKPDIDNPVSCEIREVVNGSITPTIYGHKTLHTSSVSVSSDGSAATRFSFDDPVLLEENKEYAFVLRSQSPSYSVWVAELGENDVSSGDLVVTNPYLIGLMMSSSNNSSWTMHQTTDVKFRLIADNYSNSSIVLFNNIAATDEFSRIYLIADSVVPDGTAVNWSYSLDSGTTYKNIAPYNLQQLDQLKSNILVKATLTKGSTTTLSPILAVDAAAVDLSHYDTEGYYISRNITGLDAYTNVDIILDTYIPSSTSIKVYVSNDNGTTLTEATLQTGAVNLNYGWKEQTYKITVSSSTQCKLFIKLESDYEYFTPSFKRVRMIMS